MLVFNLNWSTMRLQLQILPCKWMTPFNTEPYHSQPATCTLYFSSISPLPSSTTAAHPYGQDRNPVTMNTDLIYSSKLYQATSHQVTYWTPSWQPTHNPMVLGEMGCVDADWWRLVCFLSNRQWIETLTNPNLPWVKIFH